MNSLKNRIVQKGSPFELQNASCEGILFKNFAYGPKTLQDVFRKVRTFSRRECIIFGNTRISYGQMFERAILLSNILKERYGIKNGNKIGLIMEKCPEWAVSFMAIHFTGAVSVTVCADMDIKEAMSELDVAKCVMIITDKKRSEKIEKLRPTLSVVSIFDEDDIRADKKYNDNRRSCLNLSKFLYSGIKNDTSTDKKDTFTKLNPDDEAMIAFTSGTTGAPKGVVLSHRNMTTGLMNMMLGGYLATSINVKNQKMKHSKSSNLPPCTLLLSPFSHIGGYAQLILMCHLGGKIVLMPKWDVRKALTVIESEKVRSITGASIEMVRELMRADRKGYNLETLTALNIHGASLDRSLINEIKMGFPDINLGTGYGMTETCGTVASASEIDLENKPGTSGMVIPSVDIKTIDSEGNEMPMGGYGEICIRGAMVMKEYCGKKEKTDQVLRDGWLRTGDLGYVDDDGYLYLIDRIKDIIICGEYRVSAGTIERKLNSHSLIDEAIAIGMPNGEKSEYILIAAVIKENKNIDKKILKNELLSRLGKLPVPIKLKFKKAVPRTISGKVNRNELRQQLLQ